MSRFKGLNIYAGLARDVVKQLNKSKDEEVLYKFIIALCHYAEESPTHFIMPIVDLPPKVKEEKIPKHKRVYDKNNIGLRFTKNCVISNKCTKDCYRYDICKADYKKRIADEKNKEDKRIDTEN